MFIIFNDRIIMIKLFSNRFQTESFIQKERGISTAEAKVIIFNLYFYSIRIFDYITNNYIFLLYYDMHNILNIK